MPETDATPLLRQRQTRLGWTVLSVPYTAKPDYDFERACIGMEQDAIATELLINWLASSGMRVYPEFREEIHVAKEPLEYDPDLPLHISFDWGLSPACCIGQLSSFGQLLIFPSLHPEEREYEGVYAFAEKVADHLLREYAAPYDLSLEELPLVVIGDPAGKARGQHVVSGKKAKELASCFDILYRGLELDLGQDENGKTVTEKLPGWGWRVIAGDVSHKKRQEAVRYRLKTLVHGLPALLLDPREEFIQSACLGGYHYKERSDGTLENEPEKNASSHIMNALEYLCTRISARPAAKEDEDDETYPRYQFSSQASGSRWR